MTCCCSSTSEREANRDGPTNAPCNSACNPQLSRLFRSICESDSFGPQLRTFSQSCEEFVRVEVRFARRMKLYWEAEAPLRLQYGSLELQSKPLVCNVLVQFFSDLKRPKSFGNDIVACMSLRSRMLMTGLLPDTPPRLGIACMVSSCRLINR